MGVTVKLASAFYSIGEIVFYRGLLGSLLMVLWARRQRVSLRTTVPRLHLVRGASGVAALMLWFYAISVLPLATAVTLNYMSSIWMALFLLGAALLFGSRRVDIRLVLTVLLGFGGVVAVLQPTVNQQQWLGGAVGLLSGMLSAVAYLQVSALGRVGEPEPRIVFYFSMGGMLAGLTLALSQGPLHGHSMHGASLLVATGVPATVAQLLMTRAYAIGRALSNASLQYLGIVFSFGYGVWLFDDPVSAVALLGMVMIVLAGVAATLLRTRNSA
jgi:S-adenosylmethionine uptake transporter